MTLRRIYLKIINTRFFIRYKKPLVIKHGRVIKRKGKRRIVVEFDDNTKLTLKEYRDADLEIGRTGDFIFSGRYLYEFEIDSELIYETVTKKWNSHFNLSPNKKSPFRWFFSL